MAALVIPVVVFGSLFNMSAASGVQSDGFITGNVAECGPGPIVPLLSAASPAMVVVLLHDHTYESHSIIFPKHIPWIGFFKFKVPPGTYNVVSSYGGAERSVVVKSGGRIVVNFGVIDCPD